MGVMSLGLVACNNSNTSSAAPSSVASSVASSVVSSVASSAAASSVVSSAAIVSSSAVVSSEAAPILTHSVDFSKCVRVEEGSDMLEKSEDGFFIHREENGKMKAVDTSRWQIIGNSEVNSDKNRKTIYFDATAPGILKFNVRSGTANESTRSVYVAAVDTTDNSIISYLAMSSLKNRVKESDSTKAEAIDSEMEVVIPKAGRYHILVSAAANFNKLEFYDDPSKEGEIVVAKDDIPEEFAGLDAQYYVPGVLTAERKYNGFTFPESNDAQVRYYGKVTFNSIDTSSVDTAGAKNKYACFEFKNGYQFTFTNEYAGTLSLGFAGRNSDESASKVKYGKSADAMTESDDLKYKTGTTLNLQLTPGTWTIEAVGTVDLYYGNFVVAE